jgi:hypothetical protein
LGPDIGYNNKGIITKLNAVEKFKVGLGLETEEVLFDFNKRKT